MSWVMSINGRTLAALGMSARSLEGWLDGHTITRDATALPGVLGVVPHQLSVSASRQIRVTCNLPVTSLLDRAAKLADVQDAIASLCTLRFADTPGRVVRALAGPLVVASIAPNISMTPTAASLVLVLTFTAYDTASYDEEPRVVSLTTTPGALPLGTLPSTGIVQLSGAWSTGDPRTLTYRSLNGIAYGALTLTPPTGQSLSASEFLEIDLSRQYCTKVGNTGVRTNAYAWKSGGAWFVPDPSDGSRAASAWPTLAVSAGVGLFLYRRAWAL